MGQGIYVLDMMQPAAFKTVTADALDPRVARSSADMALIMKGRSSTWKGLIHWGWVTRVRN